MRSLFHFPNKHPQCKQIEPGSKPLGIQVYFFSVGFFDSFTKYSHTATHSYANLHWPSDKALSIADFMICANERY